MKSEEEFVSEAVKDFPELREVESVDVLQCCETIYGNGFANGVSGNVESPTGHFYRIDRWIVVTDSAGNSELNSFDSSEEASKEFNKLETQYSLWDSPEEIEAYGWN